MPLANPAVLANPTSSINVLRAVILTPTSAGLIFNSRGVTRQVNKLLIFFKDQNYTRKDRYERILYYVNIILRDNIKVIPEYAKTLFNKDTFFTTLKKKY